MGYLQLGLLFLKLANQFLDYARQRQAFNAGQDAEIAKQSIGILKMTQKAKEIDEAVEKMSDPDILAALAKSGDLRKD